MQLYYGTYLRQDVHKNYIVDIPESIISTGDFKKYKKLNTFIYVPKKESGNFETDEIQALITPLSKEKFDKLFFIELEMSNKSGAFLTFLELFKSDDFKINIEECRAIDSVDENKGRVELIVTANVLNTTELSDAEYLKKELLEKYIEKNKEGKYIDKKDNDFISVRKPFDESFFENYKSNDCEENEGKGKGVDEIGKMFGETFPIILPTECLKKTFNTTYPFLGITYISEGNFILIKFKSIDEKIIPLEVTFTSDNYGLLINVIQPLAEIGVNLRLILPNELNNNKTYHIYFNIENTKLTLYNKETIIKIIEGHIGSNEGIKINILENLHAVLGEKKLNANFINASNRDFFKKTLIDIKGWKDKLANCANSCIPNSCPISQNWNLEKVLLNNLVEKIVNLRLENISIPEELKSIRYLSKDTCTFQNQLLMFKTALIEVENRKDETLAKYGEINKNVK